VLKFYFLPQQKSFIKKGDDGVMAGQIRMTPDQLQAKAKRYGHSAQQIEQILRDLSNLQEELRGEWEGRAFERFDDQFRQLKPKVQDFAQLMQEIEMQLTKTAEAVAQQDEALSQNFGLR
jgi:WXG100 family type VII secretion target